PGDFTVTVGADRRDVAAGGVAIAGDTVTLTLSSPVLAVDAVQVRYTAGADPLRDAAANAVADFGDQTVTNDTTPDTTEPVFSSAAVNGTTLTLTFNEALDPSSEPAPSAFTVTVGSSRTQVAQGGVAIAGDTVTLTLSSAVQYGATVRVRYSKPSSGPLQDHSANAVASFGNQTVTNDTPDTTNPTFSSAVVDRATLTVTFSKDLNSVSVPVPGDFTVKVNEGTRGVAADGVVIDGKTVTLTLESAVSGGQIVTVAYTAGTPPLQDRSVTPNAVETFGDQPVTNETVPWLPDDVVVSGVKLTLIYDQPLDNAGSVVNNTEPTAPCPATSFHPGFIGSGYFTLTATDSTITVVYDNRAPTSHKFQLCKSGNTSVDRETANSQGTQHTFTGLDEDTDYWVRVLEASTTPSDWNYIRTTSLLSVPAAGDFVVSVGGTVWQLVEPADALSDGVNPPKVPTVLLVGNTAFVAPGQDGNQVELTHADDIAQSFTTGNHPDGYTLRSVEAFMKNEGTPAPSYTAVGIHADSSGAPGAPGASVGTLTKQGSPGSDRSKVRFTSSDAGIALEPNTTYWFVLDLSAAFNDVKLFATTAKTERSDTGSLTDWSLGDGHRSRSPASSVWNQTDNDNVIQIDIRGHVAITPVAVRDSRVILTLHPDAGDLVAKGGRVTLSYTAGTDPVRGADGTEAASFADRSVKNLASDRTAPTLRAVTVDTTGGPTDKLILTYNERLDPDSVPAPATFLVQVGINRVAVTNVEVSGRQVTLTLAAAVPEGEYVGVNFPTSAAIQDYAGNPAAPIQLETAEHGPPPADTPSSGGGTPSGGGFVGGGGGGGAGPSGPSTSTVDFEWNVKRDIDALDSGHDNPTGLWGDGETLLLLENGSGADD
ncbi:MAG: SwmB domain-containing protein, partial [Gemmatimonadetes bacterium]|nr:SwmB domain-containing protein [Gemmatimonadota bacterium]